MKFRILIAGLALLATLWSSAGELGAPSTTELGNEAADLPFDARHLGLYGALFAAGLTLTMLALMEIGRRVGTRHLTPDATETRKGLAAVDGVIFSLLGLLVAFAFYGAAERFDARRKLVIQEADCISIAWSRLDLLAGDERLALRELFRQYLDARLDTDWKASDAIKTVPRSLKLQRDIWQRALAACYGSEPSPAGTHLVPALNQMFSIAHDRTAIARIHPPKIIFATLIALTLVSAVLVGHGMAGRRSRSWIHIVGFVITMVSVIYLIFELEYPRLGLVRIDPMDQVLVDLRQSMD